MHFLKGARIHILTKPWAMVECEVVARNTLRVQATVVRRDVELPNVFVAKSGTAWAQLPEHMQVVGADGEVIAPSKGRVFFVSAGTFNPWHGLLEMDPREMWC